MGSMKDLSVDQKVLNMVIVYGALILGEVVFAGIVLFRRLSGKVELIEVAAILALVALFMAVGSGAAALIARMVMLRQLGAAETFNAAMDKYFAAFIISMALCEGSVFFTLMVILLGGTVHLWFLAALLLLVQLSFMPSKGRVEAVHKTAREKEKIEKML